MKIIKTVFLFASLTLITFGTSYGQNDVSELNVNGGSVTFIPPPKGSDPWSGVFYKQGMFFKNRANVTFASLEYILNPTSANNSLYLGFGGGTPGGKGFHLFENGEAYLGYDIFKTFPKGNKLNVNGDTYIDGSLKVKREWGDWISLVDGYKKDLYGFHNPNQGGRMELYIQDGVTGIKNFGVFTVIRNGNIGIGTTNPGIYKLAVNGTIHTKEVKVDLIGWADYVFADDYQLPTLQEVAAHIQEKGHLINIPSAAEVAENGILLGEMNSKLLEKIEELTLYTLDQEERIKLLEIQNSKINQLEKQLNLLLKTK